MNTPALIIFASVGLGTIGGGVAATLLTPGPESEVESPATVSDVSSLDLEELRQENERLLDRVKELEFKMAAVGNKREPVGEVLTRAEVEEMLADLTGGSSKLAPVKAVTEHADFEEKVAEVLENRQRAEADAKLQQYQESRAAKLDTRIADLTTKLDLNSRQSEDLRVAFEQRQARETEMYQQWRDGAADEVVGELKRTNQEVFRTSLQGILTPTQLETFDQTEGRRGGK